MRKQTDISQQIKKYLDGGLDARAMHELERRAQDDPFLMDALEGYQTTPVEMNADLDNLNNRLQQRIAKKEARIIPWRIMGIAASILILLGLGLFWYSEREPSVIMQKNIAQTSPVSKPEAVQPVVPSVAAKVDSNHTPDHNLVADNRIKHRPHSTVTYATPDVEADAAAASPPQISEVQPALAAVDKVTDSTPLNEVAVMEYSSQQKDARMKDKTVAKVADTVLRPSSNAFAANEKSDALSLKEVRIKGTDTAKLDNNRFGYVAHSSSQDIAQQKMIGYQPRSRQSINDIPTINARPVASVPVGAIHGYFAKRSSAASGVTPLNPVILHGKMVKGMVKELGEPVAYATVKIKGTTISTLTDAKGRFTLYTVPDSAILQVSAEGYVMKETKVTKRDLQLISIHQSVNAPDDAGTQVNENNIVQDIQARPSTGWDDLEGYLRKSAVSPDGKTGVVKLSFTVNADNSLSDFKVIKGVSVQTDNAAIKLIKDGPLWYSSPDDKAQVVTVNIKFHIRGK